MDQNRYCVYNLTSECFLSLGVTRKGRGLARVRKAPRYDEGQWLSRPTGVRLLRLFSSRDLVFLDARHSVVRVIESFPPFRFAPMGKNVASVLELPVHTIDSSRTQAGNELVICELEEMVSRLRGVSGPEVHGTGKDDLVERPAPG
jgi:hypothetical protein